jgi:integrase
MQYNVTYRDKDGGIQVIVSYKDSTGQWRQKSEQGFAKKGDAKKAANKILDELKEKHALQLNPELDGITFGEFIKTFLEHMKIYKEPNTVISYTQALKKFSAMDKMSLDKITPLHIQKEIDVMVIDGLKARTIKGYVTRLKTMFKNAIKPYRIIFDNPVTSLELPEGKIEVKLKAINLSDLEKLLSNIKNPRHYLISLLAGKCGLRIGEIIGLTWADLNFNKQTIDINKQWKLLKSGKYGFGPPKTKLSYRTVPAPRSVLQVLKEYKKISPANIDGRIFNYSRAGTIASILADVYRHHEYNLSVHDLRHTFASLLIANGTDFRTAAQILGHTPEETIRTYSHVTSDMMDRAAKTINNIFD